VKTKRPPPDIAHHRSNTDAAFIVLQERDDFCGVRVVPIGKRLEKNTAGRQVGKGEQRKTFAHRVLPVLDPRMSLLCAAKCKGILCGKAKDNYSPGENLILFFGRNLPANN
jgi:hypothetical protein